MPSHQDVPSYEKPSSDGSTKGRVQITGVVGNSYIKRQVLCWFSTSCHPYRSSLATTIDNDRMADKIAAMPMALPGSGNKPLSRPAHALTFEAVLDELQGDTNAGLTPADAKERLQIYGSNDLGDGAGVQPAKILLRQVANAMTLVTCTITTYERGETADPLAYRCSSWQWP